MYQQYIFQLHYEVSSITECIRGSWPDALLKHDNLPDFDSRRTDTVTAAAAAAVTAIAAC